MSIIYLYMVGGDHADVVTLCLCIVHRAYSTDWPTCAPNARKFLAVSWPSLATTAPCAKSASSGWVQIPSAPTATNSSHQELLLVHIRSFFFLKSHYEVEREEVLEGGGRYVGVVSISALPQYL